jgi:ketosteroid isomerase-like protein
MSKDLEQRLARLEDLEAIRDVIAYYADAVDHNGDVAMLKKCFTADAVWTSKDIGTWKGRATIVRALHKVCTVQIPWALHYMTQPVIKRAANGRGASAHYYLWELAKFRATPDAAPESTWLGGWYDSQFRKENGVWRFSKIVLTIRLLTPHREPDWRTLR